VSSPISLSDLPDFELLPRDDAGVPHAWGLFGDDDQLGLMNLQTPERVASAARLIRTGRRFPLDVALGAISRAFFDRGTPRHAIIERRPGHGLDDVIDNLYPQGGSQWDSLGHIPARPGVYYNGVSTDEVKGGRNTIDNWARHGIAGRGVLLDVAGIVSERGGAGSAVPVTVEDLEAVRIAAGVDFQPGDILVLHTGFVSWYLNQDLTTRRRASRKETMAAPGIEPGEAMARYLWDSHVSAVVSDTTGVEVQPFDSAPGDPYAELHPTLIGRFGMALGELWWLEDLARACRDEGVWEFFVSSTPVNMPGGIGSPANALAIM
jgi:kynurenine formamidase